MGFIKLPRDASVAADISCGFDRTSASQFPTMIPYGLTSYKILITPVSIMEVKLDGMSIFQQTEVKRIAIWKQKSI